MHRVRVAIGAAMIARRLLEWHALLSQVVAFCN